jgi:hypothetical protein
VQNNYATELRFKTDKLGSISFNDVTANLFPRKFIAGAPHPTHDRYSHCDVDADLNWPAEPKRGERRMESHRTRQRVIACVRANARWVSRYFGSHPRRLHPLRAVLPGDIASALENSGFSL